MINSIWPQIKKSYGGGILTSVETDSGGVAKQLDTDVGIDFIQTDKNQVCHTYATRVQAVGKFWKTFTVRSEKTSGKRTEMEKRTNAITHNGTLPKYTCQGYVNNWNDNLFLGCAVIETEELFRIIQMYTNERGFCSLKKRINPQDGTAFVVVDYDCLKYKGARTLQIFDGKTANQLQFDLS